MIKNTFCYQFKASNDTLKSDENRDRSDEKYNKLKTGNPIFKNSFKIHRLFLDIFSINCSATLLILLKKIYQCSKVFIYSYRFRCRIYDFDQI